MVVEKLYNKLYKLFIRELSDLQIGRTYNISRLNELIDIINAIDYINHGHLSRKEIIKILKHYE